MGFIRESHTHRVLTYLPMFLLPLTLELLVVLGSVSDTEKET